MQAVEPANLQADDFKQENESIPKIDHEYPNAAPRSNILDDSVKDKIFEVESSSLEKDIESTISTYEKNQLIAKQKEALDKVGFSLDWIYLNEQCIIFLCNYQFLQP